MAHYFVGDIQGCFDELEALLASVDFSPSRDELWAVGDLVARGPKSLTTLRYLKSLGDSAKVVLGNHDLHLMATYGKVKKSNPKDKLADFLEAKDAPLLIDWLRQQPLARELSSHRLIMSHAGVPPHWTLETLRSQVKQVSQALQDQDYLHNLIAKMYTQSPASWNSDLDKSAQQRYCINALTRMRYLHVDGRLDFLCKQSPLTSHNDQLIPWYELPSTIGQTHELVFGHWAALMGQTGNPRFHALDTGCCWGGYLTLWHLESNQTIIQNSMAS